MGKRKDPWRFKPRPRRAVDVKAELDRAVRGLEQAIEGIPVRTADDVRAQFDIAHGVFLAKVKQDGLYIAAKELRGVFVTLKAKAQAAKIDTPIVQGIDAMLECCEVLH